MLSVIVPTLNRSQTLAEMLHSLSCQTLPASDYEVLIVDNGSTDDTSEVAASFIAESQNIRYFFEQTPGLHSGRHRGLAHAESDILVFADDDIEPFPTWLEAIENRFRDPDLALLGGNNLPMFLGHPANWLLNLWHNFESRFGQSFPPLSILEWTAREEEFRAQYVWGCNFSIRKSVLLKAEGFHPDGMPDALNRFRGDGEVYVSQYVENNKLGVGFEPNASVYHKVSASRLDQDYFRRRGFNQGISDSYTSLRNSTEKSGSVSSSIAARVLGRIRRMRRSMRLTTEAKAVLDTMNAGYADGFSYHQQCYRSDPDVRRWVHKRNYLEDESND